MADNKSSVGASALNQVAGKNYKYGGDAAFGAFIPERREILREEVQNQLIGYDDRGREIRQTIPAQYGESEVDFSYSPVVRGARSAGSFLNDIFFGDANEQSQAAGNAVSAIRGVVKAVPQMIDEQMRAAGSGGRYYDPETRRIVEFDPTLVMGGGSSGGGSALASGFRSSGGGRQAARMQRAQEGGFDLDRTLYHYTDKLEDGEEFTSLSITPENAQTKLGRGIYTSPDNQYGDRYIRQGQDMSKAYGENARAIPVYARGKIATESDYETAYRSATENLNIKAQRGVVDANTKLNIRNNVQDEAQRILKDQGFTGVKFMDEVMIFDPKDVRSVNAEFDPTRADSANILYSGGGRQGSAIAGGSALRETFRIGDEGFDPRFDDRALEQGRIANTQLDYNVRPFERPDVSIFDLEGKPFRLTMSDRTAAGRDLTGVEGVQYDIPINLQGGQDFMFSNPLGREGQVWAQDKGSTSKYLNSFLGLDGQPIGDEVLMLPFRMAPTGGDFATMTSELMVTHARNNVSAKAKKQADKRIKEFYPEWKGIDNPESLQQISNMKGDPRKALINVMDKDLRNEGGLGIGQARLAVSDRSQYNALDTGLQNVGIATTDIASVNRRGRPTLERFEDSGHRTYAQGLSGRPMGSLIEQDVSAYELLPDYLVGRGFRDFEDLMSTGDLANEAFTLRRGTRGGVITEEMLRDIQARRAN